MEGKRENQTRTAMAEASSILHPYKLPTPNLISPPIAQKAMSRVFSSILYKPVFFGVIITLLPLFPSQAPEFIGESILTKVWEILQLLFVGISVSYGIFSRRNAEADTGKEVLQKDESPRSFVSQMVHGSLVFDEGDDGIGSMNESKIQTWSSQCYKNEPTLAASKLLLLPIRSIKSQNQEIDGQFTSANCGIKSHFFYSKNESAVLPSPIPWISRSGSMRSKIEQVAGVEDSSSSSGSSTVPSTPASSTSPSPRLLSPSPLFPSDTAKPKSVHKNKTTPPAPPPPPSPEYLKHGHEYQCTAGKFKEELKGSSRRECWDTPSDTVRTNNEQAENCGEEVQVAVTVALAEASGGGKEDASNCEAGAGGEENEVDKKADEFIARFREQIWLQRIESFKRSTIEKPSKE